jgi:hypothetical protein
MENGARGAATYKVVVRGELDDRFAYLFTGMQMQRVEGTTVLVGKVIDQAQLHGFIERIEELGLELLSVEQTSGSSRGVANTGSKTERGESGC